VVALRTSTPPSLSAQVGLALHRDRALLHGRFVCREGATIWPTCRRRTLAGDAPIYDPEMARPATLDEVQAPPR